jgi:hypothetical protein
LVKYDEAYNNNNKIARVRHQQKQQVSSLCNEQSALRGAVSHITRHISLSYIALTTTEQYAAQRSPDKFVNNRGSVGGRQNKQRHTAGASKPNNLRNYFTI